MAIGVGGDDESTHRSPPLSKDRRNARYESPNWDDPSFDLRLGSSAVLEIGVLGPLELTADGIEVQVRRARERALLSRLVIDAGQTLSADRLTDAVWGEQLPANPAAALQTAISRLRKALGSEVIVTRAGGYMLLPDRVSVDADRFESLLSSASREADQARALQMVESALALWRGVPYTEFAYEEFTQAEIERLDELRLSAVELRMRSLIALGQHTSVIPELRTLVSDHPRREPLWEHLMLALYRSGRQADALSAYQLARQHLVEELGLEPGPSLRTLEERILMQDPALEPNAPPSPRRPTSVASTFRPPVPIASLIGRGEELAFVEGRLDAGRLVTITGPAGVGKTRLSIQVANEVEDRYADGVVYLDLDSHDDTLSISDLLAFVLGSPAGEGARERIIDSLSQRQQLVLVDGCDRMLAKAAEFVHVVLKNCREISVLATSRQRLGITGETILALEPLVGAKTHHGVELLLDRAEAAGARVDRSEVGSDLLERMVHSLDGLPLALELAAARLRVMPIEHLARDLRERTDVLISTDPTAPDKHQSLETAVASSWDLLDDEQRDLFLAMSVVHTPWDPDTAARMVDRPDDILGVEKVVLDLAERSLVSPLVRSGADTDIRFTMLRTLRDFGLRRLEGSGLLTQMQARHAHVFAKLAEETRGPRDENMFGVPEDLSAQLRAFEIRLPDYETAMDWALSHDAPLALRMASALAQFLVLTERNQQGIRWLRVSLDESADDSWRPHALADLAVMVRPVSSLVADGARFGTPFDNWRDPQRYHADDTARARESVELYVEALNLMEETGTRPHPWDRIELARSMATAGDMDEALHVLTDSLHHLEPTDSEGRCFANQMMARIELARGRIDEAVRRATDPTCRNSEFIRTIAGHDTLGRIAFAQGDFATATTHYTRLLTEYAEPYHEPGVAIVHGFLGLLAGLTGRPDDMRSHAGKALAVGRRFAMPRVEAEARLNQGWAALLEGDHDQSHAYLEHSYGLAKAEGDARGVALAIALWALDRFSTGDVDLALELFRRALVEPQGVVGRYVEAWCILNIARCLVRRDDVELAASLSGAAEAARLSTQVPFLNLLGTTPGPVDEVAAAIAACGHEEAYEVGGEMALSAAVDLAVGDFRAVWGPGLSRGPADT